MKLFSIVLYLASVSALLPSGAAELEEYDDYNLRRFHPENQLEQDEWGVPESPLRNFRQLKSKESKAPKMKSTKSPSMSPTTSRPSMAPTPEPTESPTQSPTVTPTTAAPSAAPTPTPAPTFAPTKATKAPKASKTPKASKAPKA